LLFASALGHPFENGSAEQARRKVQSIEVVGEYLLRVRMTVFT
jgi:hypothetical protein